MYRKLRYRTYEANETVFEYGDVGELFYIIMEGEVIIKVPSPGMLEGERATAENFLLHYLICDFDSVNWHKLSHGS